MTVLQLTPDTLPQSLQLQQDIDHRTVVRSSAAEQGGTMGHSVTKLYLHFLCRNCDCFYLSVPLCFLWEVPSILSLLNCSHSKACVEDRQIE